MRHRNRVPCNTASAVPNEDGFLNRSLLLPSRAQTARYVLAPKRSVSFDRRLP